MLVSIRTFHISETMWVKSDTAVRAITVGVVTATVCVGMEVKGHLYLVHPVSDFHKIRYRRCPSPLFFLNVWRFFFLKIGAARKAYTSLLGA